MAYIGSCWNPEDRADVARPSAVTAARDADRDQPLACWPPEEDFSDGLFERYETRARRLREDAILRSLRATDAWVAAFVRLICGN